MVKWALTPTDFSSKSGSAFPSFVAMGKVFTSPSLSICKTGVNSSTYFVGLLRAIVSAREMSSVFL